MSKKSKQLKLLFALSLVVFLGAGLTKAYFSSKENIKDNKFSIKTATITSTASSTETATSTSTSTYTNIVINEVYYDVDMTHGDEGRNEWIELYNPNASDVNIKDWSITDNSGVAHTINANVSIPGFGFALLSHDNNTWGYWGSPSGSKIITTNLGGSPGSGWLGNSGDRVLLKNASNLLIDQMNYFDDTSIWNPACPDVSQGHSLSRGTLGSDTNQPSDFIDLSSPTPGGA